MSNFNFETITAAQALGITAGDHLTVSSGPADAATVLYGAAGDITLVLGAQSVDFGGGLAALSQAGGVTFTDGTVLYVGDGGSNTKDFGIFSTTSGAFFGGAGNDTVQTGEGSFVVQGNAGDDSITIGPGGHNTIYGGQGDDFVTIASGGGFAPALNFVQGNMGNDNIVGGPGDDILLGGKGDDTITGNNGVDIIDGNLGNDNLIGDGQLLGEDGNDTISNLVGGAATILGGAGDDLIFSSILNGVSGSPTVIHGDDGNDNIGVWGPSHDEVFGDAGADTITDSAGGNDSIDGGDGNDRLVAVAANTTVNGGTGDDTIELQGAGIIAFGGSGRDTFVIETIASRVGGAPSDRIHIMDWASEDSIRLTSIDSAHISYGEATASDEIAAASNFNLAPNAILAVQVGTEVLVLFQPGAAAGAALNSLEAITLVGRTLADIDVSNFI